MSYIAFAYIPGRTLKDRITETRLDLEEMSGIAADIGAGLDAMHAHNVVHRDIKPSNVLLDENGSALIADLGLAKGRAYTVLTNAGQVMGTLPYLGKRGADRYQQASGAGGQGAGRNDGVRT